MSMIAEALVRHGAPTGEPGECVGSKFHSPTPLVVQRVQVGDKTYSLCSTCVDNIGVFVHLMDSTEGSLSWEVRREFGNIIRDLGMKAWRHKESRD